MLGLNTALQGLEAKGCRIRLAVSGASWVGSGLVTQIGQMKGMEVVLIADVDVERARQALLSAGCDPHAVAMTDDASQARAAIARGQKVITTDCSLPANLDNVDIVTDATDSPSIGAQTAYSCIRNGKPIVMINIEADVTVGNILQRMAKQAGVLYTVSSGDEPGALKELYDFADGLGYEVIAIGKGKNNPLNRAANPDVVAEQAQRVGKDPAQIAYFVDGTKTMFEMACISNGAGLPPATRGMFGPPATPETVAKAFALQEDGGILAHPGVVDYVTGSAMAGGVFVVVRVANNRIREDLEYLKVGRGPYFAFIRPYHLWFLEAPLSIARAHIRNEPTLVPLEQPTSDVMAVAKRHLGAGEILDGFGGFCTYGILERASVARTLNALPMGLAAGAKLTRNVAQGEVLRYDSVELNEDALLVRLRRDQDALGDTDGVSGSPAAIGLRR